MYQKMYERLKDEFTTMIEDTLTREKQAPIGAFPNDAALDKHRGILLSLEGCKTSYKQLWEKIEREKQEYAAADEIIPPPAFIDAEIISQEEA